MVKALVSISASVFPPAGWMTQARWRASQTVKEELGVGGWEDSPGEIFPEKRKEKKRLTALHQRPVAIETMPLKAIQPHVFKWDSLLLLDADNRMHLNVLELLTGEIYDAILTSLRCTDASDSPERKTLAYRMHKYSTEVMDFSCACVAGLRYKNLISVAWV